MSVPRLLPLDPDTPVTFRGQRAAPEGELMERIDSLWTEAHGSVSGRHHDQPILSVAAIAETGIHVEAVPYRYYAAQRRDPTLAAALAVRPLAVSGIVFCSDKVILGRRSQHVTQDTGMLELVPGGSVEAKRVRPDGAVDLAGQFLAELAEEIGVTPPAGAAPRIVGFIEDEAESVVDAVLTLTLLETEAEVRWAHADLATNEYEEFVFATPVEARAMLAKDPGDLSPVTRTIFQSWDVVVGSERQEEVAGGGTVNRDRRPTDRPGL